MSLKAVDGILSSLKSCQTDLGTGMDIVTDIAMDLAETQDEDMNPGIKEMEAMILECAKLDSEINYFVDIVQQVEMVNPMKNKKCNHHYDEEAILSLIKTKQSQKKMCRCPVVGCGNGDVKESDLIPDQIFIYFLNKRY
uniref:E3 SUMO-protein ligase NSE2 n=1 Tax=Xiphophorus couchianus TaxID=32473 RepID=A0A3B5MDZ3_9TELE